MQIELKLLKHQKNFLFHKKPFGGLVAGFGSGKSHIATIKTIFFNINNPGINSAYYLPTHPLIRDVCYDKFPQILEEVFKITNFTLNKSTSEIILHDYNNKILFRSMTEPEKIVGFEVGYSIIDECDILSEEKMVEVYNKVLGRNRKPLKNDQQNILDIVGTPEGFKFFYKTFVENKKENQVLIRAKSTDNKHLPQSYLDQLRETYDPKLLEQYLNGEFVNINGDNVYSSFDREKNVENIDDFKKEVLQVHPLLVGQDFNVGACISIIAVELGSKIIIIDEIISDTTFDIEERIREKYKDNKITIYPDASGGSSSSNASKSDIDILRSAGFRINAPSKNPKISDRVNSVNSLFRKGNLIIGENCVNLIKALEQQIYDKTGKPEKFNIHPAIDDYVDALGYLIHQKHQIIKPQIKSFQMG